jgi:hypothetical protein
MQYSSSLFPESESEHVITPSTSLPTWLELESGRDGSADDIFPLAASQTNIFSFEQNTHTLPLPSHLYTNFDTHTSSETTLNFTGVDVDNGAGPGAGTDTNTDVGIHIGIPSVSSDLHSFDCDMSSDVCSTQSRKRRAYDCDFAYPSLSLSPTMDSQVVTDSHSLSPSTSLPSYGSGADLMPTIGLGTSLPLLDPMLDASLPCSHQTSSLSSLSAAEWPTSPTDAYRSDSTQHITPIPVSSDPDVTLVSQPRHKRIRRTTNDDIPSYESDIQSDTKSIRLRSAAASAASAIAATSSFISTSSTGSCASIGPDSSTECNGAAANHLDLSTATVPSSYIDAETGKIVCPLCKSQRKFSEKHHLSIGACWRCTKSVALRLSLHVNTLDESKLRQVIGRVLDRNRTAMEQRLEERETNKAVRNLDPKNNLKRLVRKDSDNRSQFIDQALELLRNPKSKANASIRDYAWKRATFPIFQAVGRFIAQVSNCTETAQLRTYVEQECNLVRRFLEAAEYHNLNHVLSQHCHTPESPWCPTSSPPCRFRGRKGKLGILYMAGFGVLMIVTLYMSPAVMRHKMSAPSVGSSNEVYSMIKPYQAPTGNTFSATPNANTITSQHTRADDHSGHDRSRHVRSKKVRGEPVGSSMDGSSTLFGGSPPQAGLDDTEEADMASEAAFAPVTGSAPAPASSSSSSSSSSSPQPSLQPSEPTIEAPGKIEKEGATSMADGTVHRHRNPDEAAVPYSPSISLLNQGFRQIAFVDFLKHIGSAFSYAVDLPSIIASHADTLIKESCIPPGATTLSTIKNRVSITYWIKDDQSSKPRYAIVLQQCILEYVRQQEWRMMQ